MKGFGRHSSHQQKDATTVECRVCGPPYVFRHKPTEHLFLEYSFHVRRVTISSLLGIFILLTAVMAILHFVYQKEATEKNLYHASLSALGILLYIFINTKFLRSWNQLRVAAYILWVLLLLLSAMSLPLGAWKSIGTDTALIYPAEGIWQLMFIIYCMYLILSVNFFMTLVFGIVLSVVHTAVVLIRLQDLPSIKQNWPEVLVDVVLLATVNAVGIMAHHIAEKSQRESFINCRAYIGAKLQFQEQGQKLVKVAETCLPKFLCHDVCADLTMYNNIVCPRQIFAKSYECVSIAYINITGLEKLKAQTDAAEYVSIINDLAVTFEALCEVHNCLALVLRGEQFAAVSGVPLSDPQGPQACVSLCLDMIQAVQLVQQATCSAVDALTGVHFGSVAAGVIGTYRWQYKCCGNDVLLARHLALTSTSGKVHISEPCVGYLPLNMYEVQQSARSHGLTIPTYYIQPNLANQKISPTVMRLNRRLNQTDSVASFMRLDSLENEEPFFTQLFRSNDSKPAMTTCLMDGKAFVHRLAHDNIENDITNKAFQHAVKIGSVEHETSEQLSFFSLKFHERLMESSFSKELKGFGISLAFILLLLVALAVLHFAVLSRTMLMLSSVLFLFIFLSLLCIAVIGSKLQAMRCRCLSQHTNKLCLLIIIIVLVACSSLLNMLTCQGSSFYDSLPLALRYSILNTDVSHASCSSPYFLFLSGVLVLFVISVTRISHIIQAVLVVLVTSGYVVVIAYTHGPLFHLHDSVYRSSLPPSSVMAIVALVHFALLHVLVNRHCEWVRRLDYIWRHKEMSSYQKAQDMITLRLGVAENTLPAHALIHYSSPEGVMKPYSQSHNLVGVAFITIPNFSGFINDMHRANQPQALVQVLHDVTSAFDHLLRRSEFHIIEKVYDEGLNYVLVSGINRTSASLTQREQAYTEHHLCKLLDLLLDMKHCLLQLNAMSGRNLVLRAGVSMGSIVEGVFGYKRPQYNIWGPAVDVAKTLELSGKMNHVQVNKEVTQVLRRRYQFQPRTQGNMAVYQELQPYVVVSRRLQSVIASDNESACSDSNERMRSPPMQNHSMGSISQAETVIVSSQPHRPGVIPSTSSNSRIRTASFEMRGTDPMSGMMYIGNSGNSTPSGSFQRNQSMEGAFMEGWKMPPSPSLARLTAVSRAISPELPAVHYTKAKTPPIGRVASSDSRGTIILTQANLTGTPSHSSISSQPMDLQNSPCADFIHPSTANMQSPQPKLANVVTTDSMGRSSRRQLTPVGEMGSNGRERSRQSSGSVSSSLPPGRATPVSVQDRTVSSHSGRMTPNSAGSARSSYRDKVTGNGFVYPAPMSPPPQQKMSPALNYTRSPNRLPSRSSSQSSHRDSSKPQRNVDSSDQEMYSLEYKDTVPLLASHDRSHGKSHDRQHDQVDSRAPHQKKPPVILGLDKLMSSSMYSDKMQTSMEGNVSSTSTTPDEEVPMLMPLQSLKHSQDVAGVTNNPSLSPLLKRQLNRFAAKQDSRHKSPHLPRKQLARTNSSGSRTGANTICSLSPPCTPTEDPATTPPVSDPHTPSNQDGDDETDNCNQWSGARPKQWSNNIVEQASDVKATSPLLLHPPPPVDCMTESELSEMSDDDNVNVKNVYDANITDYDNMYSTDYGTYDNRVRAGPPYKYSKEPYDPKIGAANYSRSNKFMSKLEQMQRSGQNVRELYSEVESDAADCESLVGDTDCEAEPIGTTSASHEYAHPLQKLQWAENKLLALLKPSTGTLSTMGSTLRHCRSMELLPSETEGTTERSRRKRSSQRRLAADHSSQLFDDNISITSSMLGSEFSRSDPYLSDIGAYESEYDNYPPGLMSDDNFFSNKPIADIDLNQFGNIDFDKIKMNENMTTQDYILNLQQQIESKQKSGVGTDV